MHRKIDWKTQSTLRSINDDHFKNKTDSQYASMLLFLRLLVLIFLVSFPLKNLNALPSSEKKSVHSQKDKPKNEGWRFAGLPLLGYNIERGLGLGAYLAVFNKRPLAKDEQGVNYKFAFNSILLWTIKGYQNHRFIFDIPYLNQSDLRLRLTLRYERQDDAWHSGIGSPSALIESEIERDIYVHGLQSLWLISSLTQPLKSIHPSLNITVGWILRDVETNMSSQTLLSQNQPIGVHGGFLSQFQANVGWDTRDREPDTQSGVWLEASLRKSHPILLSDWNYTGFNITYRHYIPLLKSPRMIYAHRLGYDEQYGEVPYFQRNIMGGTQWTELGGNSVLRSYKFGRFRPSRALYLSQEIRTSITRLMVFGRTLDLIVTPLFDLGYFQGENKTYTDPNGIVALTKTDWLWGSLGAGLRLIYDEGIVIRADMMWAYERIVLENHQVEARPQFGLFIMTGHSF